MFPPGIRMYRLGRPVKYPSLSVKDLVAVSSNLQVPFSSQCFQPAKFANHASRAPREGAGKLKHKGFWARQYKPQPSHMASSGPSWTQTFFTIARTNRSCTQ